MPSLAIHAGPHARQRLLEEGLRPESFKVMVGASGGPKWFVLYGLDRYLFGEFFAGRREPLYTLGSSAGAWRMACLATAEPVAAIERLGRYYSQQHYSEKPSLLEVTEKARELLSGVLGLEGGTRIVSNDVFRTHIVTCRVRGLGASRRRALQTLHLGLTAGCNIVSRRTLSWYLQRTVFTNMGELSPWSGLEDLDTVFVELTEDNVFAAMIATGSIPFVLEGERDIPGAKPGLYWDGGITDYHFDLPFLPGDGLVLYPHFNATLVPGWFDKHLAWRRPRARHYHNVVLLAPTPEFIRSLPGGKLPDRTDFERYEFAEREQVFREAMHRSEELAEELAELVRNGVDAQRIQPIENLR